MPDDLTTTWDAMADYGDEHPPSPIQLRGEGVLPLGHNRGVFYYYSVAAGQVYELTPNAHNQGTLSAIAHVQHFWERSTWHGKKGVRWTEAAAALMASCRDVGIYSPERLRGRGAWLDGLRTVLHIGDRLIVDGNDTGSCQLDDSTYIYEQGQHLRVKIGDKPLSNLAASRLMDLCMAPSWRDPESMGKLLAGWIVIAPVCGAMPWRPHLYVTSEGGGGKTWVMDNIVRPAIGEIALRVQSKTTEAGVRQLLGADARPVLFDEFESQNDRDRDRVQQVLDLARQASSEDGAAIVKGGQDGRARLYHIRSVFAFSSINLGLTQAADESRTVVLTLIPSTDAAIRSAAFDSLKAIHAKVMTPDFPAALIARTLRLLPVIRANAELFAQAIARSGQPRRLGDTIGVLLAGAWSLRSTRHVTAHEADEFIAGSSWVQAAVTRSETVPEWQRALAFLVQQRLRIVPSNNRPEDVPIGELLTVASGRGHDLMTIGTDDANRALARAGIRVVFEGADTLVWVANTSDQIAQFFAGSAWTTGWLETLARSPGASKGPPKKFGGHTSRYTSLPINLWIGADDG